MFRRNKVPYVTTHCTLADGTPYTYQANLEPVGNAFDEVLNVGGLALIAILEAGREVVVNHVPTPVRNLSVSAWNSGREIIAKRTAPVRNLFSHRREQLGTLHDHEPSGRR